MSDSEANPWTTLSTRVVYDNKWIRVREDQVINPAGGPGIYGVVEYKNRAVGVVPVDDEGFTWLVGQYRYTQGRYEWEIPEGGCPVGENLLDCARRELREETGLIAEHYRDDRQGLAAVELDHERGSVSFHRARSHLGRGKPGGHGETASETRAAQRRRAHGACWGDPRCDVGDRAVDGGDLGLRTPRPF